MGGNELFSPLGLGFAIFLVAALAIDFGLLRKNGTHVVPVKEAAAWTLVAHDHTIAGTNLVVQDALDCFFLALEHTCWTAELQQFLSDTGRLHNAALLGNIAE